MRNLTFLLYILAESVNNIRPALVEALQDWPATTSDINLIDVDALKFCKAIKLNISQTQKFIENFNNQSVEQFYAALAKNKIKAINIFELQYPTLLLQIPDPPLVLYCRGKNLKLLESISLAMVGSRKATAYGKSVSLEKGPDEDNDDYYLTKMFFPE